MKITNITQKENNIFEVTITPNAFERFFGVKEEKHLYKDMKTTYKLFPSINAYHDQKGKILQPTDSIVIAIEEWRRRF